MAPKKKYDNKFFFTPVFHCCVWIRDPRSGIRDGSKSGSGIRDKHPGSATLKGKISFSNQILICRGCVALQWERVGDGFVVKKRGWNIAYKVKESQICTVKKKHPDKNTIFFNVEV
jgi:hypothetical protein